MSCNTITTYWTALKDNTINGFIDGIKRLMSNDNDMTDFDCLWTEAQDQKVNNNIDYLVCKYIMNDCMNAFDGRFENKIDIILREWLDHYSDYYRNYNICYIRDSETNKIIAITISFLCEN